MLPGSIESPQAESEGLRSKQPSELELEAEGIEQGADSICSRAFRTCPPALQGPFLAQAGEFFSWSPPVATPVALCRQACLCSFSCAFLPSFIMHSHYGSPPLSVEICPKTPVDA